MTKQNTCPLFFAAIKNEDLAIIDSIVAIGYNDHLAGQNLGCETLKTVFHDAWFCFYRLENANLGHHWPKVILLLLSNNAKGTHKDEFGALNQIIL